MTIERLKIDWTEEYPDFTARFKEAFAHRPDLIVAIDYDGPELSIFLATQTTTPDHVVAEMLIAGNVEELCRKVHPDLLRHRFYLEWFSIISDRQRKAADA